MNNISVIIPCYNHGDLLHRKLQTLAQQTTKPSEVLIVDDGSVRYTEELYSAVHEHKHEFDIDVFVHPRNLGVPSACNTGIIRANNEYLFLTALDDTIIYPNLFADALEQFRQRPRVGFVSFMSDIYDDRTGLVWTLGDRKNLYHSGPSAYDAIASGTFAAQGQATVYRKSLFNRHGLYEPRHKWHHDVWCLYEHAHRYGYVSRAVVATKFNQRAGSYCTGRRKWKDEVDALESLIVSFQGNNTLFYGALCNSPQFAAFGVPLLAALRRQDCMKYVDADFIYTAIKATLKDYAAHKLPAPLVRYIARTRFPQQYLVAQ